MWAFYLLLAILLTPTAVVAALYASRIRFSRRIVARTKPAQQTPESCRRVIVVAGDSTAFGVGALPAETTAGRIAALFPHARVINVARSGANVGRVVEQLNSLDIEHADMVLIHACANDVLEFRNPLKVEADLRTALGRAKALSSNVVIMPGHDFSVAPFFLRPLSRAIKWQAEKVHAIVKRVTQELGVMFVDLYRDPTAEPFVREPRRYYCPDGLHPSGEGYAIWFSALLASVPLARFLAESSSGSD
ncbi:MAG TPA: SGNH/GDSL hydrolase family protein [Usitatibacter sp.]|nr:SGNH/GDSL hydrolase family protein [Usitatibacter sp.]